MGLLSVTKSQTAANVAEAATTGTLKNAMLSLKTVAGNVGATIKGMFASNPIGMWFMVISTGVSMLSTAISKTNEKLEETRQKNIESATTASENADKLKDLYNEYSRLASIQDRTSSEEESFKTAVENITVALGDKAEILKDLTAVQMNMQMHLQGQQKKSYRGRQLPQRLAEKRQKRIYKARHGINGAVHKLP